MKRILILIVVIMGFVGLFYYRITIKDFLVDSNQPEIPVAVEYQNVEDYKTIINDQKPNNEVQNQNSEIIPLSYNLDVPFTSQAPFADWNETFKEACEEASALMVHYFYQSQNFTPQLATEEILKMVDWQLANFGGHYDITVEQTTEMIKKYLGYKNVEIINNPTVENIKSYIFQNHPVIIPVAGRELGNPYFTQPGPIYHMLIIKGYTEDQFITNDPGTKRGEDFLYDYDVIINSIHDWNEEDILQGSKRIIVIYPN